MGNQFDKEFYEFAMLALLVLVALERISHATALAQLIDGFLVLLMIVIYIVHDFKQKK